MNSLPSGLEEIPRDAESLARFVTSSGWVAKSTGRVKHQAFLPAPDDDTSVYRVDGMSKPEIWAHAEQHFVNRSGQPYPHHGAAVSTVSVVREAGIEVIAHEPPPKHANLRGWPKHDDRELQKSRRKEIATRIADAASFLSNA